MLYTWRCGDASNESAFKFQELYRSDDHALHWDFAGVKFTPASFKGSRNGFFCPTFLQFGKDYQGARDSYVYIYAPEQTTSGWEVQKPGQITLLRVPKDALGDQSRYEAFAGINRRGQPTWTASLDARQPVFEDAQNGVMRTSASYNPGLKRYFLIVEHTERSQGNIGIYDAPAPWGPWTTVLFQTGFGAPQIAASTFFWNFSNKWLSADGKEFVLVFTGSGENDLWNTVEGRFLLQKAPTYFVGQDFCSSRR